MKTKEKRAQGTTIAGVFAYFMGLVMILVGGYLFMNRVIVTSYGFNLNFGRGIAVNNLGLALIPLVIGIGILFFNVKSIIGWVLAVSGLLIVIAGVLLSLNIYFQPTNLLDTILIMGTFAGGIGLMVRAR